MTKQNFKAPHLQTGEKGENIACEFLLKKDFVVIEKNWRFKRTEIDIIARHKETIVFIEVKTRSNIKFGFPEVFVGAKKQKDICIAANHYLEINNLDYKVRFDIIAINRIPNNWEIEHIEDAFFPMG